jgi:hypothetical protein
MNYCERQPDWMIHAAVATVAFALMLALSACAGKSALPPPPPPAVEVLVPVPVPCEIVQVPVSEKPIPSSDMGIFDLVKTALARLAVTDGENERLRAANTSPCPVQQ